MTTASRTCGPASVWRCTRVTATIPRRCSTRPTTPCTRPSGRASGRTSPPDGRLGGQLPRLGVDSRAHTCQSERCSPPTHGACVDPQHLSAFTRLRGLLEVTRLVRSDEDLDHLLARPPRTPAASLGFGTVVLNLSRRAWDAFCTPTLHGSQHPRETLLGDARGWDVWGRVL